MKRSRPIKRRPVTLERKGPEMLNARPLEEKCVCGRDRVKAFAPGICPHGAFIRGEEPK